MKIRFFLKKIHQNFRTKILVGFLEFFETEFEGDFGQFFGRFLVILEDFLDLFEGAPLQGALGRAPPPFCRAEILKKFRGKSVPENYTLSKTPCGLSPPSPVPFWTILLESPAAEQHAKNVSDDFGRFFFTFLKARPFGARWAGPPLLFLERKS